MICILGTTVESVLDQALTVGGPAALVSAADLAAARARRGAHGERTLAGRVALRLLLAHVQGDELADAAHLPVDRTCERCGADHGRPRSPRVSLSSSTSQRHVLVAVGPEKMRIGVDAQALPASIWPGFDTAVLHPREHRLHDDGDVRARIALWTRKEAVLKAAGVGLQVDPSRLCLERRPVLERSPVPDRSQQSWWTVSGESPPQLQGLHVRDLPGAVPRALAASAPSTVRRIDLDAVLPLS
ncbi:4'-phosphopantetheinyl transferase family protein [Brachybacterium alimentarium]|uniref:4'-phosphopantetheinyl transferase family protein n=1 Tax=Brachybacterium alimentarium TaxID=47845 RepID=UPI003FD18572